MKINSFQGELTDSLNGSTAQYRTEKVSAVLLLQPTRPMRNAGDNPKTGNMGSSIPIKFNGITNNVALAEPAALTHQLQSHTALPFKPIYRLVHPEN